MIEQNIGERISPDDRIKSQTEILDKFEKQAGLPECKSPGTEDELSEYLNMPREAIELLSAIDCSEISYKLAQYAFYLQRVTNRQKERVNWISTEIDKVIAPKISQYSGNWTMQKSAAIADNDFCRRYQQIQQECQQRIDRLDYLSKCISNMSEQMKNLSFAKRGESNG